MSLQAVRDIGHRPIHVLSALGLVLFGLPALLLGTGALGLYLYFFVFPPPVLLPEPNVATVARTSHIYDGQGKLLAALHAEHNREPVKLDQMSPAIRNAVIAAEDARFFQHKGLDFKSVVRAILADVRAGGSVQGGSTITQQYVKNAYVGNKENLFRKAREALVASRLERTYSKKTILERYLNAVYFGRGAYGVEAAAKTYFDRPASDLSVSQAALLAGMIPSPAKFSPYDHPSEAEQRRQYVVGRMEAAGLIDPGAAQAAVSDRPELQVPKPNEEVFAYPYFVDAVKRHLEETYGRSKLFNGGLEAYTTLDPTLQKAAEKTISDTLPSNSDPLASIVSVEPSTGYVKALVGGRDFAKEKFNLAVQARRQPGSSFKPFTLVGALEAGVLPTDRYDGPAKYCGLAGYRSKDGCVNNFNNQGFGSITVEKATYNSVNTVYIQLAQRIGVSRLINVAERMGISRRSLEKDQDNIAISLGGFTEGVTPFEMASAFSTLAARGIHHQPLFTSKVIDADGKVLQEGPAKPEKAVDQVVSDNATAILRKVISDGTGKRADIGRPAAGKTGTAEDFTNAWFVGYTPQLATSVWMGYRLPRPMKDLHGVHEVVGGSLPAQMWGSYMKIAMAPIPPSNFADPGALETIELPFGESPSPEATVAPEPSLSPYQPPNFLAPSPGASPSADTGGGLLGRLLR